MYIYLIVCWVYILFTPDLDECIKFMKISAWLWNDLSIFVSMCILRSNVLCILNCKFFTFSKLLCKTGQDGFSPIWYFIKAFSSLWSSSLGFQIKCSEETGWAVTLMFVERPKILGFQQWLEFFSCHMNIRVDVHWESQS